MTIDEQMVLFYKRIRQTAANSNITSTDAMDYINDGRKAEALKRKFYRLDFTDTAVAGDNVWAVDSDFTPLENARDWATINGRPITMKGVGEWAYLTQGNLLIVSGFFSTWGMLDKGNFYLYPSAKTGDVILLKGTGLPAPLAAITGADPAALTDAEATLGVLAGAMQALEDNNGEPGPLLIKDYNEYAKLVEARAKPRGARLHAAPEMWH